MPQDQDKGEGAKVPGKNAAFKENMIRIVTVFAYVSSVSMAALVLSSYYVFFWEPKPPGPGPPVIHPHAYVAEPYPPLKLVAPPPDGHETEGASFWQSVWSYLKPDEKVSTQFPMAYTRRRAKPTSTTKSYNHAHSTTFNYTDVPSETFNYTDHEISTLMTSQATVEYTPILPEEETSVLNEVINIKPAEKDTNEGYIGIIPNRVKRGMKSREKITQENRKLLALTTKDLGATYSESKLIISTTEAASGNTVLHNNDLRTENEKDYNKTIEDKVDKTYVEKTTIQVETKSGREMKKMTKHDTSETSTEDHDYHNQERTYTIDNINVGKELDKDYIRDITNTKESTDPTTTIKTTPPLGEVKSTSVINNLIKRNTYQYNIEKNITRNTDVETKPAILLEVESTHHKENQNIKNKTKAIDTTENMNKPNHDNNYIERKTQQVHSTTDAEILTNTEKIEVAFAGARNIIIKRDTNENSTDDKVTHTVNKTNIGFATDDTVEDKEYIKVEAHTTDSIWTTETITPHTTMSRLEESAGMVNKIIKRDTNQSITDDSINLQNTVTNYSLSVETKPEPSNHSEKNGLGSSGSVNSVSPNSVTETNASHVSLTTTGGSSETKLLGISDTTDSDELVTKSVDDVTIEETVETLSTEIDMQYQHHMRQLRPRRKFPSLHT